ncbi:unnamed protein product [Closterium sp. NIES-65]|nr:unnamed protein product [Closterium sp. NIES-65]
MVGARRARFRGGAGETGIGRSSERGGGEERRWIRAERCDGVAGKVGKGGEDGEDGERWGGWEGWGGWGGSGRWGGWECTLLSLPSLPPVLHVPRAEKKEGVTTAEDVEFFLRRRFPSCKLEYIGGQPGQAKEKGEGIVWPVFVFDPFVNDTAFASMLQPIKGLSPPAAPPKTRESAVLRLRTFMCMHSHRWIDILRLDIAGLELDLCENAATAAAAGGGGGGLGGGDAFSTSVGDLTQHGAAALAEKTPVGPTPGSVPIGQVAVMFHAELAGRDGAKRRQKCEETFAAWGLKKVACDGGWEHRAVCSH